MLELDHVIIAVHDLGRAATRLEREHGLAAVEGGRHAGHGTANMIVPLGNAYLELMAVVDHDEASASPLGRFVTGFVADGERPMAVCLRTDALDAVAERLGLPVFAMTRTRPDGVVLAWRLAGLDDAFGPERLPFFIDWQVEPADHPARAVADHRVRVDGIERVDLGVDPGALVGRLGQNDLAIRAVGGDPGVHAVTIATSDGTVVL